MDTTRSVGVVGLGRDGLPLAWAFSRRGVRVLGFDPDAERVTRLRGGESGTPTVPSHAVRAMLAAGFEPTTDFARLAGPDAVVVCTPTPLTPTGGPDLDGVTAAAAAVAGRLRAGQLVVLTRAVYPGATRGLVAPALRAGGRDLLVAYSPGREWPAGPAADAPRVVGGLDAAGHARAVALFRLLGAGVVEVSGPEAAEAYHLLTGGLRATAAAAANELADLYARMGVDVRAVFAAAAAAGDAAPFGGPSTSPGPVAGEAASAPALLGWAARRHKQSVRLVELAGEVNAAVPTVVVDRVADTLNAAGRPVRGSRVAVLGLPPVEDSAAPHRPPGIHLLLLLAGKGAVVTYHDPGVPTLPAADRLPGLPAGSSPLTAEYLAAQDCVLVAAPAGIDGRFVAAHARCVVDLPSAVPQIPGGRVEADPG